MRPIDADALKEMIPTTSVDMFENCRNCSLLSEEQVNELIDMTPTVNSWISCSERLPEKEGEYIACRGNGSIAILHYNTIQTMSYPLGFSKVSEETGWSWRQPNVVAWMPLPEPYREEAQPWPTTSSGR